MASGNNAYIGIDNAVITGALTASSEAQPVDNLKNRQGSPAYAWQTTGISAESVLIDTGDAAWQWDIVALTRTNLTASATIRICIGDAAMTVISYDSGIISAGVIFDIGVDYLQSIIPIPGSPVGAAMKIFLADPSNSDGFLSVPLAFAGPAFQPSINYDFSSTVGRIDNTAENVFKGGQDFPLTTYQVRQDIIYFKALFSSEVRPDIVRLNSISRRGQNILWVPDPNGQNIGRESIFGRLQPVSLVTYSGQSPGFKSFNFTITERL